MISTENYQWIDAGRCHPELAGWYVSREAAERILIQQENDKFDCQLAVLDADTKRRDAEERQRIAEESSSKSRWWATWGFPLGLVSGLVGIVVIGFAVGYSGKN